MSRPWVAAAAVVFASCLLSAAQAAAAEAMSAEPIPGPRTCFWKGPFSADPYINIAYPDKHVFYWSAGFTVPAGAELSIDGDFARARYLSFVSYDPRGRPAEALADYLIQPLAGHVNPFQDGADRRATQRRYSISIREGTPVGSLEGYQEAGAARNILHAPKAEGRQTVLYRIYLPDQAAPVTGGVELPAPVLKLADGRVVRGDEACRHLGRQRVSRLSPDALGIAASRYRELISQPGKPDTWPAKVDPEWHIQLDRQSLIGIYTGKIDPTARRSEGGFFPNPDNNYLRTLINLRFGKVVVLRGRMPLTPKTAGGDARMTAGQVRYWSICSNQSFANTRVTDCLHDEQVPTDERGYYTIVVSKEKDRPRNARPECGLAWLKVADDGDGLFDPDVAILQIRNLLARPDFAQAVQRVDVDANIDPVMGDYKPRATYAMPGAVEAIFGC